MENNQISAAIFEMRRKLGLSFEGEVLLYLDEETRNRKHDYTDVLDYLYMQIDDREQRLDDFRKAAVDKSSAGPRLSIRFGVKTPKQLMDEIELLNRMVDAVKESDAELYLYFPCYWRKETDTYEMRLFEASLVKTESEKESGYGLSVSVGKNGQVTLKPQKAATRNVICETYHFRDAVSGKELGDIHPVYETDWEWDDENNAGSSCYEFNVFDMHSLAPIDVESGLESMIAAVDAEKAAYWQPYFNKKLMALSTDQLKDAEQTINGVLDKYRPACCKDCHKIFIQPAYEAEWYTRRGLTPPKRCKNCRDKRAEQKAMQNNI